MGGPNNTCHNFADMVCRCFSKRARRDFKKQQQREKKERERWRSRHNSDIEYESETSVDLNIGYPGSESMPNIVPFGAPRRSPVSMPRRLSAPLVPSKAGRLPSFYDVSNWPVDVHELNSSPRWMPSHSSPSSVPSRASWPSQPSYSSNPPVGEWQPPPGLAPKHPAAPQLPQESTRIGWDPEPSNDRIRPSRSRHTSSPRPVPNYEATAIPMTETRGSVRLPTCQAPLLDNERTLIEGMGLPTAHGTGRQRRRR